MRKADLINKIAEKTNIPKVDVLVTLETMFKEIKATLSKGENIYVRGFGSFITKQRAAKIGRNIKRNTAVAPARYGYLLSTRWFGTSLTTTAATIIAKQVSQT